MALGSQHQSSTRPQPHCLSRRNGKNFQTIQTEEQVTEAVSRVQCLCKHSAVDPATASNGKGDIEETDDPKSNQESGSATHKQEWLDWSIMALKTLEGISEISTVLSPLKAICKTTSTILERIQVIWYLWHQSMISKSFPDHACKQRRVERCA